MALLAGCATGPTANPKDPIEPFNREVSRIDEDFDKGVLRPVAQLYADYIPTPAQRALENFFSNVSDVKCSKDAPPGPSTKLGKSIG